MAAYRFKVTFEEQEDVYREIEIRSTQTFEDLHNAIQSAIGFDNSKEASFFISDDYWRKGEEISLKKHDGMRSMAKSKIAGFIEDPHQKILYYFDTEVQWGFYVELLKIIQEDDKVNYPKCSKTVGIAPKQYKETTLPAPVEEDDDDHDHKLKEKEKIFTSEEGYDVPEEEEDVLIESEDGVVGEEEVAGEEGAEPETEDPGTVEED